MSLFFVAVNCSTSSSKLRRNRCVLTKTVGQTWKQHPKYRPLTTADILTCRDRNSIYVSPRVQPVKTARTARGPTREHYQTVIHVINYTFVFHGKMSAEQKVRVFPTVWRSSSQGMKARLEVVEQVFQLFIIKSTLLINWSCCLWNVRKTIIMSLSSWWHLQTV